MRIPAIISAYVCFLLTTALSIDITESELLLLISLSRHGSRAPNPSVKANCPNNLPNIKSYDVPLEQLTERGMKEMEEVGQHIRNVYVHEKGFLSSTFNGPEDDRHFEGYFRADAANRCGQSAVSMGYGLYPNGTGPGGYSQQPIPVYMQLFENEHDFTANGPCWSVMSANNKVYTNGRAAIAIERHKKSLETLANICGKFFYISNDPVTAIKDVNDMFLFDLNEGHDPLLGLTPELLQDISELAFQHLIERLYSTPTQITVSIGGFPQLLIRNLREGASPNKNPENPKYLSYHGHRELMHGLGFMIGMKFQFEGLPKYNGSTPLHPASTLFFELHRKADNHFVQIFLWSPFSPRTAIKLDTCELECPLSDFTAIIESFIKSTGPWQDICSYHPVNMPVVKDTKPNDVYTDTTGNIKDAQVEKAGALWSIVTASGFVSLGTIGGITYQRFMSRRGYQPM
ncbi:hypothetical protein L914_10919 [Plasmopara halstedii]|uniref:Uncharacterized protein n=1 Tax=Plasmopara halstedii TaxID=4781 RepID=A0A0P1B5N0_PLAHL|nr:hypothetical protein L914_10919 [Plasmopara halstedii]CEG50092.1 hypothetical protein L914_10919 [Plasmopara halstedii]|eukprot:XP_024586461.1 hypothetical protein L914_10919 [Plasmopara halstedii]